MPRDYAYEAYSAVQESKMLDQHLEGSDDAEYLDDHGWEQAGLNEDGEQLWSKKWYGITLTRTEAQAVEWQQGRAA